MTDATASALIVAVPLAITSIGGIIIQVILTIRGSVQAKVTDEKVDVVIGKSNEIHELADGNLSKMRNDLKDMTGKFDVANERIHGLEKLVSQLATSKQEADKAAELAAKKEAKPERKPGKGDKP